MTPRASVMSSNVSRPGDLYGMTTPPSQCWISAYSLASSVQLSPFKRNVEIFQYDRTGVMQRKWRLYGCWPKRFVAGDWDNDADENVIETLVLAIDYFELGFQV